MTTLPSYDVSAVAGLGEVAPGTDLGELLTRLVPLRDGDVLVVTSKVVSKAEGRVVESVGPEGGRDRAVDEETDRVVARRGPTRIVRTRHGLVMAAAGVDASNTAPGTLVLLPLDPDASARRLREAVLSRTGRNVAVVVSDTSGRAWRTGQTDVAVGAAGLVVLDDHAGRADAHGNLLAVTAPALADEVAGAGDLVKGKTAGTPVALLRGLGRLVLPAGVHGPGAAALVRPEGEDLFGLGAREAVVHALALQEPRGFGAAAGTEALRLALAAAGVVASAAAADGSVSVTAPADAFEAGHFCARVDALAWAHGWFREPSPGDQPHRPGPGTPLTYRPRTP